MSGRAKKLPTLPRWLRWVARLGAVVVIGLVCLLIAIGVKRSSAYHYDVRVDQNYTFAPGIAGQKIALKNQSLNLPAEVGPGSTVLLRVRISPSLGGYWFAPRVVATDGRQRVVQTFERGGAGLRWINLSGLMASAGAPIRLETDHLDLADQEGMLYVFPNGWHTGHERVLVLSPHPDDAEIAAFGYYSQTDAYVVTLTAGEAGEPSTFGRFGDRQDVHRYKGLERAWNSATVPMLGGVGIERTANLGYFDGTLTAMHDAQGGAVHSRDTSATTLDSFRYAAAPGFVPARAGAPATWPNLVDDLAYLIDEIRPDVIVTVFPALDMHPDHKMCTIALLDALKKTHTRPAYLLLYTNHMPASYMYPFGHAGSAVSLPPVTLKVPVDGVFSFPLSKLLQARKFMALEAMTDIRLNDRVGSIGDAGLRLYETVRSGTNDSDGSYFRRADRANELFFVVDTRHLEDPYWVAGIIGTAP